MASIGGRDRSWTSCEDSSVVKNGSRVKGTERGERKLVLSECFQPHPGALVRPRCRPPRTPPSPPPPHHFAPFSFCLAHPPTLVLCRRRLTLSRHRLACPPDSILLNTKTTADTLSRCHRPPHRRLGSLPPSRLITQFHPVGYQDDGGLVVPPPPAHPSPAIIPPPRQDSTPAASSSTPPSSVPDKQQPPLSTPPARPSTYPQSSRMVSPSALHLLQENMIIDAGRITGTDVCGMLAKGNVLAFLAFLTRLQRTATLPSRSTARRLLPWEVPLHLGPVCADSHGYATLGVLPGGRVRSQSATRHSPLGALRPYESVNMAVPNNDTTG
ncbi:uncharacterized protein FIBRA_08997 [Fibroporia radiculosa]|uniref:Uncharacterized protein n=1 Tax=Fibroporia radiculosa TaxID=599839 RepID=J4GIN9_9APHY|nr:uncharacterized protein FIBRA_08997 [Fibroporia radiculosa]CCM06708.1 predicted protein [Fibroporia radiculosa]